MIIVKAGISQSLLLKPLPAAQESMFPGHLLLKW